MKLTLDRVLGILGIAVGVPAVLELFRSERIREGLLLSALIVLIFAVFGYLQYRESLGLFDYKEIHKQLTFVSEDGNLATLETRAVIKANQRVQQFWFRNLNADGKISNFLVDGTTPPPGHVQQKAGSWEVCKQFGHLLQRGETETVVLRYDLYKSFPNPTEGLTHVTVTKTGKLTVRVEFHANRIGHNVRAFLGKGAEVEEPLDQPKGLENGRVLELIIEKPKRGGYYTLEWSW